MTTLLTYRSEPSSLVNKPTECKMDQSLQWSLSFGDGSVLPALNWLTLEAQKSPRGYPPEIAIQILWKNQKYPGEFEPQFKPNTEATGKIY